MKRSSVATRDNFVETTGREKSKGSPTLKTGSKNCAKTTETWKKKP
jgi:hypothetical protein